jgi:hypothetical protein
MEIKERFNQKPIFSPKDGSWAFVFRGKGKNMPTKTLLKPIVILLAFGLSICFLFSCTGDKQAGDKPIDAFKLKAKPYTKAKLVKEWTLKEIDPKLPHYIVSVTVNKYGVYVLVKNVETRTGHRKLTELSAEEKKREIEKMKWSFGRILTEEEYANEPGYGLKRIQMENYWIQHYTDNGVFVRQWNGQEADQKFVKPTKIASDEDSNIYVADYGSNKIEKFSPEGKFLSWWKINQDVEVNKEVTDYIWNGLAAYKDKYIYVFVPYEGITKFDTKGNILGRIKVEKKFWTKRDMNEQLLYVWDKPFDGGEAEDLDIHDISVNEEGEIFLLDFQLNVVCKIDGNGMVKNWYLAVLSEGFDSMVLHPKLWNLLKHMGLEKLNTSFADSHFMMYRPNTISSRGGNIFVTLIGNKALGILDSIIINTTNGDLQYLKQKNRSFLKGYENKTDHLDLDLDVAIAFHDKYMFLSRTVQIEKEVTLKTYCIIQKYELKEK